MEKPWRSVKQAIEQKSPPLSASQVRDQINRVLEGVKGADVSEKAATEIRIILKKSSPWEAAKLAGMGAVPSGDPSAQLNELVERLKAMGLFIVPCGELERFACSIGDHGPGWVAQVLQRDLVNDAELQPARTFVRELLNLPGSDAHAPAPSTSASNYTTGAPPKTTRFGKIFRKIYRRQP